MAAPRVRIVRFTIGIDAVLDDGENLTPIPVQPITLTAAEAGRLDVNAIAAQLQAQVDQQTSAPGADAEPALGPGVGQGNGQDAPHQQDHGDDLHDVAPLG